ncbi:MAG TPA: helix-turn-helix transcriptional regulator [Saprospiraceae bacterium]|nr:helix-turn-helix transcriptional regulator [Saprospiraceae bacterium]
MSNAHQIGLIIRSCRESRGISQDYIADMLNMAQSTYANLESGKTVLSVDRLMRITEILELDIHQVLEESIHSHLQPQHGDAKLPGRILFPDTKEAYDELIRELRNEIDFLRSLIKSESVISK